MLARRLLRFRPGLAAPAVLAFALAGCGGAGAHFQNDPRPPTPIDLSVYIANHRVSISPTHVGAGPVTLYVTNQASSRQTLQIRDGQGGALASTGAIDSGQTAQVSTDLKTPGTYEIAVGAQIPPARLHIGRSRPNADNALLQP
ncbi:MAG TPA: hypothetical protein VFN48_11415 [Solirubrobacteraceae bacterium]|nr:hypothetical protein [Solirubrobacteraceae bacterium]